MPKKVSPKHTANRLQICGATTAGVLILQNSWSMLFPFVPAQAPFIPAVLCLSAAPTAGWPILWPFQPPKPAPGSALPQCYPHGPRSPRCPASCCPFMDWNGGSLGLIKEVNEHPSRTVGMCACEQVCTCVCMYVFIETHTHIYYIYIYMLVWMYAYVHVHVIIFCMYVFAAVCLHVYTTHRHHSYGHEQIFCS